MEYGAVGVVVVGARAPRRCGCPMVGHPSVRDQPRLSWNLEPMSGVFPSIRINGCDLQPRT